MSKNLVKNLKIMLNSLPNLLEVYYHLHKFSIFFCYSFVFVSIIFLIYPIFCIYFPDIKDNLIRHYNHWNFHYKNLYHFLKYYRHKILYLYFLKIIKHPIINFFIFSNFVIFINQMFKVYFFILKQIYLILLYFWTYFLHK